MRISRLGVFGSVWAVLLVGAVGCGDDTAPPPQTCSSANCSGCCDSSGTCIPINSLTESKCGAQGSACKSCSVGQKCNLGTCTSETPTCSASNCPTGCCQNNQCMPGDTTTACGANGAACSICSGADQVCSAGVCIKKPCDATTCPTGCCMSGVCMPGTNSAACGTGGIACVDCGTGKQCNAQKVCESFQCGTATCPNGCCTAAGACVPGTTEQTCGKGGAACQVCGSGQACQNQSCQNVTTTCTAATCPNGCCDKTGQCVPGNADAACGTGGAACTACASGQACQSAKCVCTSTSCAGCCQGDLCKAGSEDTACGKSGAACQACTAPSKCLNASCQVDCSFLTCAGCCDAQKVCHDPANSSNCGLFGNPCSVCAPPASCVTDKGNCNDSTKCSSTSCKTGCCKNGACEGGTLNGACGEKGKVCETCGSPGAPHLYCGKDPFYGTLECLATNTSQWDVMLDSVVVKSGVEYDTWLEGGKDPEIYVKLTVGGVTKQSSAAKEGVTPSFNNAYLMTAKASDLGTKIHFEIWDSDTFGDDEIAKCDDAIYPAELKDGILTLTSCGGQPSNANFISITFRLKVKSI